MVQLYDTLHFRGSIEVILRDARNGKIVDRFSSNTVVTAGRRWVLEHIQSGNAQSTNPLSYLSVGTGTVAPTTADTALGSETLRKAIQSFTTSNLTSNPPSYRIECSFATNEANTTLGEVGMFNSSSGGTMLARATFGTVNKTTSNTLSVSYTVSA